MGTYGVQVHDLQIRPPLMGGEWGRASTVPRTPQAPDRPLLGGAARDYVETVSPSGTAACYNKYIYTVEDLTIHVEKVLFYMSAQARTWI